MGDQQDELAKLSSSSNHRTVAGATHQSLIDEERDDAASGKAIPDIVGSVDRSQDLMERLSPGPRIDDSSSPRDRIALGA